MADQTGRAPGGGARGQRQRRDAGAGGPKPDAQKPEGKEEGKKPDEEKLNIPDKRPKGTDGGARRIFPGLGLFRRVGKNGKRKWTLPGRINPMALVWFIPIYLLLLPLIGVQVRSERTLADPVVSLPSVNMGSVETQHFQVRFDKLQFYEVQSAAPGDVVEVIARGRVPVHRWLAENHELIQLVSPDGALEELRPDGSIVPFRNATTPADLPKGQAASPKRFLAQDALLYSLCAQFANGTKYQKTDFPVITKGANTAFQISGWQRRLGADHKPELYAYFDVRARTPFEHLHMWTGIWYKRPHLYLFPNIRWMSKTEAENAVDSSSGLFTSINDLVRRDWGWHDGFRAHVPPDVRPYWTVTVKVHR